MEKYNILVVEDDESILFNISLLLQFNNYDYITATNGREALEILTNLEKTPDLILSDIMMPEIDGYELLKIVSNDSRWDKIPFVFLSAKAAPTDIRLGKILGADDYLIKPVDEELLLSVIENKIKRIKLIESNLQEELNLNSLNKIKDLFKESKATTSINNIYLFIVEWDESLGPIVTEKYFEDNAMTIDFETIGIQLFQTTVSLFGQNGIVRPEAVLLNVHNINMKSFLLFDAIPDKNIRGNNRQIMISVIAPEISYLDSLKIRNTLTSMSLNIKQNNFQNLNRYYKDIQSILLGRAMN